MENIIYISDDELDAFLLGEAKEHWQKVAMIIMKALRAYAVLDEDRVGNRIVALVNSGRLESVGDVSNYRFSEVRLPVV